MPSRSADVSGGTTPIGWLIHGAGVAAADEVGRRRRIRPVVVLAAARLAGDWIDRVRVTGNQPCCFLIAAATVMRNRVRDDLSLDRLYPVASVGVQLERDRIAGAGKLIPVLRNEIYFGIPNALSRVQNQNLVWINSDKERFAAPVLR